nr:hypothetical protein GCM10020093_037660 [Planobispora longispora]
MEVVRVREELSVRETWPLECLHCRHEWQEEYTVRRMTDGHGHDVVVWMRGEVPVQPPWAGTNCPGCDMDTVSVFPRGVRAAARARLGGLRQPARGAAVLARPAPPVDPALLTRPCGTAPQHAVPHGPGPSLRDAPCERAAIMVRGTPGNGKDQIR